MNTIDPIAIIETFYSKESLAYSILVTHSRLVAAKAVQIAQNLNNPLVDITFVEQAAMLHDIGMIKTDAPSLDCFGDKPYITHGIIGKHMLESIGLSAHAKVCETHIGLGLPASEIMKQNLPLPKVDMIPQTIEEKIVCIADKFFSKTPGRQTEKTFKQVSIQVESWGARSVLIFNQWIEELHL